MPLMASILAVCLVAGMMLSVFTITPTDGPGKTHTRTTQPTTIQPASAQPSSAKPTATASTQVPSPRASSGPTHPSGAPRAQSTQ